MFQALQYSFMQHALIAGFLASVACGIIGTLVVINRKVSISGAIAHAAYGGIGLGYFLGIDIVLGALSFSLLAALSVGLIETRFRERPDTLIGIIWAAGMALGVIFIDLSEGYAVDLMSYLFGSILIVPTHDLWLMLGLDAIVILTVGLLAKELVAISFDRTFAQLRGIPTRALYIILLLLIALTVVMLMRIVGLIMVIALLTLPAATANRFARSIKKMMLLSILLSIVYVTVGLWLSFVLNLTAGAIIVLVASCGYAASLLLTRTRSK